MDDRNVDDFLGELFDGFQPIGKIPAEFLNGFQEHQDGQDTVPGGTVVQVDKVSGRFAAEIAAPGDHSLEDIPVSHRCAVEADFIFRKYLFQPLVGHDGGDHAVPLQEVPSLEADRRQEKDVVPVEDPAFQISDILA